MAKLVGLAFGLGETATKCSAENRRALTYNLFVNEDFDGRTGFADKKLDKISWFSIPKSASIRWVGMPYVLRIVGLWLRSPNKTLDEVRTGA